MLLLGGKRLLITKQLLKFMSAKEGKKDKRRGKNGARTTGGKVNNNKNSSDKIKMFWVAFRWAELSLKAQQLCQGRLQQPKETR